MAGEHRINRLLILGIGSVLGIYACVQAAAEETDGIEEEIHRILLEEAVRASVPGMVYEPGEQRTAGAWVMQQAMRLIPISAYAEGKLSVDTEVEDLETYEMILAQQESDENAVDENGNLIGEDDSAAASAQASAAAIDTSMEKLSNYEYLLGNFYTVDSSTMADPELINAGKLLGKDLKINESTGGPKVLIYHTHSQETFADSVPGDTSTSILGIGEYLSQLLNDTYGIETLHHQGVYDLINGKAGPEYGISAGGTGDYQDPSGESQHRSGDRPAPGRRGGGNSSGNGSKREADGTDHVFNGLSRSRANGEISYLANPYIEDNLAFSLQMQIAAARKYPGFTRHIYLRAYRYNMHLAPKTLLVEAGAQTNTVEEMRNAMEVLADTLDSVLTK